MSPIAMFFGILLTALGAALYVASDTRSVTALIPSFFGVALFVLGVIARAGGESVRKHTMHVAALLALLGCAFPAYRAVAALAQGAEMNLAIGGQIAMAVLCGVFLALCVKSFIDARRARRQSEQ